MLLRASGELKGESPDVRAVTDAAASASSGLAGGEELLAFADAVVAGEPEAIGRARESVTARLGPEASVDAAGVIGNFSRMVRIADGTGIPLDTPVKFLSADLREDLGIDAYGSSVNTPPLGRLGRVASRLAAPVLQFAVKRFAGR